MQGRKRAVRVTVLSNAPPGSSPVFDKPADGTPAKSYSYRVKIINPRLKKDTIIRDMRKYTIRFSSITDMKVRFMEEFNEQVPPSTNFSVGYFVGRTYGTKHWICTEEDLKMMYVKCPGPDIMLWCDGRSEDTETPASKRVKVDDHSSTKRESKENQIEQLAGELKERNKDKLELTEPQYRLWARLLSTGVHSSKDEPPKIPLITGVTPKRKSKVDEDRRFLQESIASTTAAVVKAVNSGGTLVQSPSIQQTVQEPSTSSNKSDNRSQLGVSPGKAAEIRGKSFGQLNALKQLYDDQVLTLEEFQEQKTVILSQLKGFK